MKLSLRGIFRSPHFKPVLIVMTMSIILIVLPLKTRTTISRVAANSILLPFIETDKYIYRVNTTFQENVTLNRRLDSLSVLSSSLIEYKSENERLRRMLEFNFELPYRLVPAEILAFSPTSQFKSVLVDVGTKRGVHRNMPVISPSGIIGKTIAADEDAATVQLLLDPGCKVAARDQRSRAMGIVEYLEGHNLAMTNVPSDQDVAIGDTIISSGLGGIFPQGLFIGTVVSSESKKGELFLDISIDPGADFSILEEVFIIVSSSEN